MTENKNIDDVVGSGPFSHVALGWLVGGFGALSLYALGVGVLEGVKPELVSAYNTQLTYGAIGTFFLGCYAGPKPLMSVLDSIGKLFFK